MKEKKKVNDQSVQRKERSDDTFVTGKNPKITDFTKGYDYLRVHNKGYTTSIRNLIHHLSTLVEHESHDELRAEYKHLLNLVTKRLQAIYDVLNR